MNSFRDAAQKLYRDYGPQKPMGAAAPELDRPHYFLHRNFLGQQDLLIILNTRRCRYQCAFCELPTKSLRIDVPDDSVLAQVQYVFEELKHSLSVLQRVTLSNEGSMLDAITLPAPTLQMILEGVSALRRVETVVLETRLEFATDSALQACKRAVGRCKLDILTGFETANERIRNDVLGKRESLNQFLAGLDIVASHRLNLTAYVLYKPDPDMTDADAMQDAQATVDYLFAETAKRKIDLTLRINPMYGATGSKWLERARSSATYSPPKFSDVLELAKATRGRGIPTYIGLSTEGLESTGFDYRARHDFSQKDVLKARIINESKLSAI